MFGCEMKFSNYCKGVEDDLSMKASLGARNQYKLIRYEDLIENPMEETKKLYSFLGIQFSTDINNQVYKHFNSDGKTNWKYMGTFRSKDFVENKKDRHPLSPSMKRDIR